MDIRVRSIWRKHLQVLNEKIPSLARNSEIKEKADISRTRIHALLFRNEPGMWADESYFCN